MYIDRPFNTYPGQSDLQSKSGIPIFHAQYISTAMQQGVQEYRIIF